MQIKHACDSSKYGIRPIITLDVKDDYCSTCGFNSELGEPYVEPLWLRFLRWLAK